MTKKEEALRVRITLAMKKRLEEIADREELSMSDIGRRALKEYLERDSGKPEKRSGRTHK